LPKLPRDATYVLDGSLERVRQSFSIPGMAIGIVENGEPVYVRAFGVRDLETGEPVTLHTKFHIASLTKTFTAAAIMQLHEQQRIALDAPIAQYVPAFANSSITVTQLLTHSAGLEDIDHKSKRSDEDALRNYVTKLAQNDVAYPPGQGWGYTDAAFNVLGAAIESITGSKYLDYMHEEVLKKAGMRESTFHRPGPGADDASPHTGKVFVRRALGYPWDGAMMPSSGLNSSINDMTRWAALHVNRDPTLLSMASYEAMFQHRLDSSWDGIAMGLGWQLEKRGDSWLPRHYGQEHGFTASITLYPQKRRAIVILSNAETTPRGEIRKLIESVLDTGSYVTPQPPLLLRFNSPWLLGGVAAFALMLVSAAVISIRRRAKS
jgi:CubicO group peptidase (beta-lactamase class C family)